MGIIDKLYNSSPVCIQNLMCSVKGWLIKRRRYNKNFLEELNKYESGAYNPDDELRKFLLQIRFLPAYNKILNQPEIVQKLKNVCEVKEILSLLPIIDKNFVKEHHDDFVNTELSEAKIEMRTSGTTGSGLIFPYSVEMENKQWAIWWRYRRRLGIDLDTWCGWFGGRSIISTKINTSPFWRINYPCKQIMFSAYHLNKDTVSYYTDEIKKRKLTWLHGYPSSIAQLASLMIDYKLPLINTVILITTGAENLYDYQIDLMKKAFPNAVVRQHYGLSEGVANFSQNIDGEWCTDDDFCYVELIPISNEDSSKCRIVGTGFSNLAFPLVRYDTGDIANVKYTEEGIKIISFDGRKEDYITFPNGVKMGRLDHIFKNCVNIKEAQIYQKAIDHVIFRIVKGINYEFDDEMQLMKEITIRFPKSIKIEIEYCDSIQRTKSGKLRLVISDIK